MSASFDLIDREWLPCILRGDPLTKLLSLREALHRAHELTGISGATPLETAALHRLLLTVLYRVFEPDEEGLDYAEQWKTIWRDGWETTRLDKYLKQWQDRFDLFDDDHPFFQDAKLKRRHESVTSLMAHVASGNDATLFDHHIKFDPQTQAGGMSLTPEEAARTLIAVQAFGLGQTQGPANNPKYPPFNNAPCTRGVIFLMEGNTLFETLMLNLFDPYMPSNRFPRRTKNGDRPAWEMDDPFKQSVKRPFGYLDYLTWHNRRVRFVPEADAGGKLMVREMMYAPGLKSYGAKGSMTRETFNPLMHWLPNETPKKEKERGKQSSHRSVSFDKEKALWRDSETLLSLPGKDMADDKAKPPHCLSWVQDLARDQFLKPEQAYRYLALGMCSQPGQDKVFFYRMEVIPLPLKFLQDATMTGDLSQGLEAAENVGRLLRSRFPSAIFTLARLSVKPGTGDNEIKRPPSSDEEKKSIANLANSWGVERYYWSGLELHFHRLVKDLPTDSEKALAEWRAQVRRAARFAFEHAEEYAGQNLRAQRAIVKAREQFDRGLNDYVPYQAKGGNV